ncbi:GAF domain-containing protein [Actinoplanes subglobosus]|uniref:GAF domain-containing protein n=1 Tax=Actinoplanes subglobosus TaxID=1547892 RepID=A0ABV8ILM1_9ACTN
MSGFEANSLDVLVDTRSETVTSLIQAATPVREQLQEVVDDVATRLDVPIAAITLVRDDAVLIAAGRGIPDWIMRAGGLPAEWSVCPRVVNPDQPLLVDDLHAVDWGFFPATAIVGPLRAYAGVPLRVDGAVVGTLCAMAPAPRAFDGGAVAVLEDRRPVAMRLLGRP